MRGNQEQREGDKLATKKPPSEHPGSLAAAHALRQGKM